MMWVNKKKLVVTSLLSDLMIDFFESHFFVSSLRPIDRLWLSLFITTDELLVYSTLEGKLKEIISNTHAVSTFVYLVTGN